VINELDSTITTYAFDMEKGGPETASDSADHTPNTHRQQHGRRGRVARRAGSCTDRIAATTVSPSSRSIGQTGMLSVVGWEPTQGRTPAVLRTRPIRHGVVRRNQNSDTVVIFRVDQSTGKLTATGQVLKAAARRRSSFGNQPANRCGTRGRYAHITWIDVDS
jgi:6-phosphogluconolactonase (cycloisomerase 2 family)